MSVKMQWNGPERKAELHAEMGRRIRACAITVQNEAKQLISVSGTASAGKGKRKIYGAAPSAPGEPPHKQTGRLRASVTYEVEGLVARIGTNVNYGRLLELGTRFMKPRPWLRRSLAQVGGTIRGILSRTMN